MPTQRLAPAGNVLTPAEQIAEQQYQTDLAAYEAEEERVRFDQATYDMQFKAAFADHEKRKQRMQEYYKSIRSRHVAIL